VTCNTNLAPEGSCGAGLFCNQGHCAKRFTRGEICTGTIGGVQIGLNLDAPYSIERWIMCEPGYFCDSGSNMCIQYKSLPKDQRCGDSLGCQDGLLCTNNVCTPVANIPQVAANCNTRDDCYNSDVPFNDRDCSCPISSGQGTCVGPFLDYTCSSTEYFNCLEGNNCDHVKQWSFVWVEGTCSNRFCKCEAVKYTQCLQRNVPAIRLAPLPPYVVCNSTPKLVISLFLSLTVIFLIY